MKVTLRDGRNETITVKSNARVPEAFTGPEWVTIVAADDSIYVLPAGDIQALVVGPKK